MHRGLRRNAMINDPGLRQGLLSSEADGEAGEVDPVKDAFSGNGKLLDEAKALSEAHDQVSNCRQTLEVNAYKSFGAVLSTCM